MTDNFIKSDIPREGWRDTGLTIIQIHETKINKSRESGFAGFNDNALKVVIKLLKNRSNLCRIFITDILSGCSRFAKIILVSYAYAGKNQEFLKAQTLDQQWYPELLVQDFPPRREA